MKNLNQEPNQQPNNQPYVISGNCLKCGKLLKREFGETSWHFLSRNYCSNDCRKTAEPVVKLDKKCLECGKPLRKTMNESTAHYNLKKFCSLNCGYKHNKRNKIGYFKYD